MNIADEDVMVTVCPNVREDAARDTMRPVIAPVRGGADAAREAVAPPSSPLPPLAELNEDYG